MKFKIGQKIKIKHTNGACWLETGKTYTVSEVNDQGYPRFLEGDHPNWFWSPGGSSSYQVVLKPGDRIKILLTRSASWIDKGETYTVTKVNDKGYPYFKESRQPDLPWSCDGDDYEIMVESAIKVGDYVNLKENPFTFYYLIVSSIQFDKATVKVYDISTNEFMAGKEYYISELVIVPSPFVKPETFIPHTKTKTEHEKDSKSTSISEVCRSSWTIKPGKRSTGTPIQSGGSKATVISGHISYKAVSG